MDVFLGRKVIQYDWRHGKVYLLSNVAADGLWLLLPLNISFKMICFLCQKNKAILTSLLSPETPPRLIQLEMFSAFSPSGFKENTGAPTNIWWVWKHQETCHGLLGTTTVEVAWMTTWCELHPTPYCKVQYTCMILSVTDNWVSNNYI